MPTPQRLPIVNSDDGTWGDILRQYLMKEHTNDDTDNAVNGGHQNITITKGTTSKAPITFTSSGASLLSSPTDGALEFDSSSAFYITTGSTRKRIAIYDDSSGATGDTYYRDSGGNFVRLGIGSTGQVLKVASGLPAWGSVSSGFATATKTATTYTITSTDTVIFADATSNNVTITLPAAASFTGYRFYVKRIDSAGNTVTIARSGSDTIDGMTSFTLDLQYTAFAVVSNGSAWYIL